MTNRSGTAWASLGRGSRRAVRFFLVTTALTLLFIWGNSLLSRESSQQTSDFVEVYVRPVLHPALSPFMTAEDIDLIEIRKLAHFAEFFALGFQLAILRYLLRWVRTVSLLLLALLPLFVALVDEGLQFISARAPSLADVGIDWAGALTGIALAWGITALVSRLRRAAEVRHA